VTACVCGAAEYRELFKTTDRSSGRSYAIAQCRRCGLARTLPPPDTEQYEAGYAPTTRDAQFTGKLHDDWSPGVARFVRDHSQGISFLDVGCSVGNLVVEASQLGFDAEGIDVDPVATEEARRAGRPVRTARVEEVTGTYDVVVANHVLEHIGDLSDFLAQVSRVLARDGRFFVFSPNHHGLIARLRRSRWMGWVPSEHVWHFTPETLASTVERASPLRAVSSTSQGVIEGPAGGPAGVAIAALTLVSKGLGRGDQVEGIFERRA
jgi:2-polyprenyl-3-methyl-5-hydroxy-6-metoxy-1,4-benzoquinol methylase